MLRLIARAGFARYGALKACATALPVGGAPACESFVHAGGLKLLFPAFMGQGCAHTRALHGARAARDETEHATSLLAALLTSLPRAPPGATASAPAPGAGLERLRLLGKFAEGGGEKVRRLVELRAAVAARVAAATAREEEEEEEEEEGREDEAELRRLDAGLFTRQRLDICAARLLTEPACLRASVGAEGKAAGAALALAEGVAFSLREQLHARGGGVVDVMVGLQELEESLPAEGGEKAAVGGMIAQLVAASGLEGGGV
jgi:hypothetical protein